MKVELLRRINEIKEEYWTKGSTTTTTTDDGTEKAASTSKVIVVEAAVLLDAGWDDLLDGVWIVTTSTETALQRLMTTRNLSKEESMKRITAQSTRRGMSTSGLQEEIDNGIITCTISNDSTLEELQQSLLRALTDPKSWKQQK